jgi:hypothetical protein
VRKSTRLVLCLLVLVAGEVWVIMSHLPWVQALWVAMFAGALALVSWRMGDLTSLPPGEEAFEHFIQEMIGVCPWMTRNDVLLLRRAFGSISSSAPIDEDLHVVAQAAWHLAERARSAGDQQRAWAFSQRYLEVCAWEQGQEYSWPLLPQTLEEG